MIRKILSINDIIVMPDRYNAHIAVKDYEIIKRETLAEHTKLCQNYFEKIAEAKSIDNILSCFKNDYLGETSQEIDTLFNEMFYNVVTFHDTGKTNYSFQKDRMQNINRDLNQSFNLPDGTHSLLSAIIYINYFSNKLIGIPKSERKLLRPFILLNSYIIARHHSNLGEFNNYLQLFQEQNEKTAKVIRVLEENAADILIDPFHLNVLKMKNIARNVVLQLEGEERCNIDVQLKSYIYSYGRLLYSVLVASDYYAASEFMSGVQTTDFGQFSNVTELISAYADTEIVKSIRKYESGNYPNAALEQETDINALRSELFLDAEKKLIKEKENHIFYLEAPTGSGKSNTAINLSFQLLRNNEKLCKIYYVYPFNTLVEQNKNTIYKLFEEKEDIIKNIVVLNSLIPIILKRKANHTDEIYETADKRYQQAILDRQFLNYPFILTTHVNLFRTMFGCGRESAFGFHQLANSVIVLDEIQSYKNSLWSEMIIFFKSFAKLLNIKIIIMSATLPNLDLLTMDKSNSIQLIENRNKFFMHKCFKNRVTFNYELLNLRVKINDLYNHVKKQLVSEKKILIEFISKKTAGNFYQILANDIEVDCLVEYISGDDSIAERNRIISNIKRNSEVILVSTQVIEAGIDIDMDIGYKDISLFDSEEQFAGRINRSCKRSGIVYYINIDDAAVLYGRDIRILPQFTLANEKMKDILNNKDFNTYYQDILNIIKENYIQNNGESGQKQFFEKVGLCKYKTVSDKMRLIDDNNWSISIFLAREIPDENNNLLDGREIWTAYKELLLDYEMAYAHKRYKLSIITAKMSYFTYQIKKDSDFHYNDRIGDMFYIEEGEKYFTNNKLDREKL